MSRSRHNIGRLSSVAGAVVLIATICLVALSAGATHATLSDVWRGDEAAITILFEIRLPRVLLGLLVGAALAIAGLTFQTILRNALADPFMLGVSGGAACGAAAGAVMGLSSVPGFVPALAFGGAALAVFGVLALAGWRRTFDPGRLILAGLVLNAFFSAVILLLLSLIRSGDLMLALRWMMGGLYSAEWNDVVTLAFFLGAGISLLFAIGGDLRMLAFGSEDAKARGVDARRVAFIGFLASSLVTGAAVAASGIIGFVGLLVPHAVRRVWGGDFRSQLWLCAVGGAVLVVIADTGARTLAGPRELPLGAITALLGVPFFLVLLTRQTE